MGPCLCLYVDEPEMIHSEEFDASHLQFINESLQQLDIRLRDFGAALNASGWLADQAGGGPRRAFGRIQGSSGAYARSSQKR